MLVRYETSKGTTKMSGQCFSLPQVRVALSEFFHDDVLQHIERTKPLGIGKQHQARFGSLRSMLDQIHLLLTIACPCSPCLLLICSWSMESSTG